MEYLTTGVLSSPCLAKHPKTHRPTLQSVFRILNSTPNSISFPNSASRFHNSHQTHFLSNKRTFCVSQKHLSNYQSNHPLRAHFSNLCGNHVLFFKESYLVEGFLKPYICCLCVGLSLPLSCFASETGLPPEEIPSKINLESILVSIDDFFNRNPFFVAGVTFIWLVVIPLTQEYFQKFKFISAINAFRKLQDDPNSQLLDIRDKKSLRYLGSPNLKILNKNTVQVEFSEGDEEGFVKNVLDKLKEPANTTICILDNFDGNSMKVAELLFKNGFKEAYAIRGGARGKNGWQEIQESLLPPSVHIYPRKKVKKSQHLEMAGRVGQGGVEGSGPSSFTSLPSSESKKMENGSVKKSVDPVSRSPTFLSPYPHYPDMKPPSSPTPGKPQNGC